MNFDPEWAPILGEALARLGEGFQRLPPVDACEDREAICQVLLETADRLLDNEPYHHPLYIGQMMKPPHPLAWLASCLASSLNPNNHALDGGRASSAMEKEAVAQIARMFSWQAHLGHLTGGGTMANFEALWVASQSRPGTAIAASTQAHYTHARLSEVLRVPFQPLAVDSHGRMDVASLEQALASDSIGTVVATLGTTAAGAVDPLDKILALRDRYDFHVHVDAAYGGYFVLVDELEPAARAAFARLGAADSIAIDPHKLGLQPYGCGCILFRDPSVERFYRHESPYTYFSSQELHLGEISLECSRAGASAVALWATQRFLPLVHGGKFAQELTVCRQAALRLHEELSRRETLQTLFPPELNIVLSAVQAPTARAASGLARELYAEAAQRDLYFALADIPRDIAQPWTKGMQWDANAVTCLRFCVMKPRHEAWMPTILQRLDQAMNAGLRREHAL